jgi:hypothetical protein
MVKTTVNMNVMEWKSKTIFLDPWVIEAVQAKAARENRSFTREAEMLLKAALDREAAAESGGPARRALAESLEVRA